LIRPRNGLVSGIVEGNGPGRDIVSSFNDDSGSSWSDLVDSVIGEIIETSLRSGTSQRSDHFKGNWHLESGDVESQTSSVVGQLVIEDELISNLGNAVSGVVNEEIK